MYACMYVSTGIKRLQPSRRRPLPVCPTEPSTTTYNVSTSGASKGTPSDAKCVTKILGGGGENKKVRERDKIDLPLFLVKRGES